MSVVSVDGCMCVRMSCIRLEVCSWPGRRDKEFSQLYHVKVGMIKETEIFAAKTGHRCIIFL